MNTHAVLMEFSEDSLLKPVREMCGMPAPSDDLGGWYHYDPVPDFIGGSMRSARLTARVGSG